MAPRSTPSSTATSTNWPGQSAWSSLVNSAFSPMVPVAGSTVFSTKTRVPRASCPPAPRGRAVTDTVPACIRRRISGRCSSGTAKRTWMGTRLRMTTSGWLSFALTTLPATTSRLPVRPVMGARSWANWTSSAAPRTCADDASSAACAAAAAACARVTSWVLASPPAARRAARSASSRAWRASA